MDCRRTLALLATFVLVGGCAPSSAFWDRSPKVAGVRRAQPPAPRPRPRAPEAAPYTAPAPSAPYGSGTAPRAQERFAPSGPTAEDVQVLERVNQIRRARGLHDFAWQSQLWRAAYDHSTEQQVHGYMGHGSPDPRRERLSQRFRQAGYEGNYYGEVVAWNYRTVEGVVRGWMNSPSHRAILLDCKMTEAAFARVGSYWTGNFGLPRARAATRPAPPAGRQQPGSTWSDGTLPPGEWIDVTPRKTTGSAPRPSVPQATYPQASYPQVPYPQAAPAPQAVHPRAEVARPAWPQAAAAPSPFYVTSTPPAGAPAPSTVRRVRMVPEGSARDLPARPPPAAPHVAAPYEAPSWPATPYAAPAPAPAPRAAPPGRDAMRYEPPAPPQPVLVPEPAPEPAPKRAPRRGSG